MLDFQWSQVRILLVDIGDINIISVSLCRTLVVVARVTSDAISSGPETMVMVANVNLRLADRNLLWYISVVIR